MSATEHGGVWNAVLGVELIPGRLQLNPPPAPSELTAAQRAQQQARLKRDIHQAAAQQHAGTYEERIAQFNDKLAKQKDAHEMPNLSG